MRFIAPLFGCALVGLSALAHAGPGSSPRLFVDGGLSAPVAPSIYRPGFGLGAGIETDTRRSVSIIAQVEVHALTAETAGGYYHGLPLAGFGSTSGGALVRTRLTLVSTVLGARFYGAGSRVRRYFDICGGVRMVSGEAPKAHEASERRGVRALNDPGLIGAVRAGVSFAPAGGAGFFADAGYEFVTGNPLRDGLLPLRFGIALH